MREEDVTNLGRVEHVLSLANLNVPSSEVAAFEEGLSVILKIVKDLEKLDAAKQGHIPDVAQELNVFRADVVKPSLTQAEALRNAPEQEDGFFVIPKLIE